MSPANRTHTSDPVVAQGEDGPITQSQHDASDAAGADVLQPSAADLGPTSGVIGETQAEADQARRASTNQDTSEVPQGAADVVAWIKDAGDDDTEAQRRAGLAWSVESQRADGVRSTVEAEVNRHLDEG